MDMTGLTNYTNYLTDTNKASTDALEKKLNSVSGTEAEDKELLEACQEFEAYLWEQIMKGMEKTIKIFDDDDDEEGYAGNMVNTFKDTMYQEIAKQVVAEGTGPNSLAQMLYEQMKRNNEAVEL